MDLKNFTILHIRKEIIKWNWKIQTTEHLIFHKENLWRILMPHLHEEKTNMFKWLTIWELWFKRQAALLPLGGWSKTKIVMYPKNNSFNYKMYFT